jgi:hypothetical protein
VIIEIGTIKIKTIKTEITGIEIETEIETIKIRKSKDQGKNKGTETKIEVGIDSTNK